MNRLRNKPLTILLFFTFFSDMTSLISQNKKYGGEGRSEQPSRPHVGL